MVVYKFDELQSAYLAYLRSNSEYLGIAADSINIGEPFKQLPAQTPYIYIFTLPESDVDNSFSPLYDLSEITVFVSGFSDADLQISVNNSMKLISKVRNMTFEGIQSQAIGCFENALKKYESPIKPEAIASNSAILSFSFNSIYIREA
jgi:hypothetical protein